MTSPIKHGGKRHGVKARGSSPAILVRLSSEDRAKLEALASSWGCSMAEAARRAIAAA